MLKKSLTEIGRSRALSRISKLTNPKVASSAELLPDNWVDFARLCQIRSGKSLVPFDPYEYQKALIECIDKHHSTVITKTRQLGMTEAIANLFLFKASINPGYLAVIFSKSQADTSNIAKRVRRQVESLSKYIVPKTDSLTDIELHSGGRILFRNSTPNGARGLESVSDILFDEAGFVSDIEEIYKASTPCTAVLGDEARIIILSTPNGQSGWYWDKLNNNNGDLELLTVCEQVRKGEIDPVQTWTDSSGWGKFVLHWMAHPEYSQRKDTYLNEVRNRLELPEHQLEQEFNLSFFDAEVIVFSSQLIRQQATGQWERDIFEMVGDGNYYLGVDTSLLGNDYTVVTVIKELNGVCSLVDMYRQRKRTHEYNIYQIKDLIEKYHPLAVGIETNAAGQIYYERLFEECPDTAIESIKTTATSKPQMISRLILALESGKLIYPNDGLIIQEFLSFRQVGSHLEAVAGKNDDIIMSLAMAVTVIPIDFGRKLPEPELMSTPPHPLEVFAEEVRIDDDIPDFN